MSSKRTQRESRIETWRVSGQSAAAYCRAQDLSYAQFVYWQRALRASPMSRDDVPALVPVQVQTTAPLIRSTTCDTRLQSHARRQLQIMPATKAG